MSMWIWLFSAAMVVMSVHSDANNEMEVSTNLHELHQRGHSLAKQLSASEHEIQQKQETLATTLRFEDKARKDLIEAANGRVQVDKVDLQRDLRRASDQVRSAHEEVDRSKRRLDDTVHHAKEQLAIRCDSMLGRSQGEAWEKCDLLHHHKHPAALGEIVVSGNNPAMCSSSSTSEMTGTLACDENHSNNGQTGEGTSACKDTELFSTFKVWIQSGIGKGECVALDQNNNGANQITKSTEHFTGKAYVLTKTFIAHPHKANKAVGVFGFKRQVCDTALANGQQSCSGFKTSYCIDCSSTTFRYPDWKQTQTNELHDQFFNTCAMFAFESTGVVKAAFQCSDADALKAKYFITAV